MPISKGQVIYLLTLHGLFSILSLAFLVFRRNSFPFDKRNLKVSIFCIISCTAFGLIEPIYHILRFNSQLLYFLNDMIIFFINLIYLFRILHIWLEHRKQKLVDAEKIVDRTLFLLKKRFTINFFAAVYILLMSYPTYSLVKDFNQVHELRSSEYSNVITGVIILIYTGLCISLRKKHDNYKLKHEIYGISSSCMAMGLIAIIVSNYEMAGMELLFKLCLIDAYLFFSFIMVGLMTFSEKAAVPILDLNTALKETLGDERLQTEFKRFLETEFSVELLDFWIKIQDYKQNRSPAVLGLKAKAIYHTYISKNADFQVNLSHRQIEAIAEQMKKQGVDELTFDVAEKEVFKLMRDNSFVRYYKEASEKGNKWKI